MQRTIYRISRAGRGPFLLLLRDVWGEVHRTDEKAKGDCSAALIC
jgi:hypothetical protein